jgi:hypothetical protein
MKRNPLSKSIAFVMILLMFEINLTSYVICNAGFSSINNNQSIIEKNPTNDLDLKKNFGNSASFEYAYWGGTRVNVEFTSRNNDAYNVTFHIKIFEGLFHTINITFDRYWGVFRQDIDYSYRQPIAGIIMPIFVEFSISADNAPTVTRHLPGFVFLCFVVIPLFGP